MFEQSAQMIPIQSLRANVTQWDNCLASTTVHSSKMHLRIHHKLLQEMHTEAFEMPPWPTY